MAEHRRDLTSDAFRADSPRPSSPDGVQQVALAALDAAVGLARAGDHQAARELCAAVAFQAQPVIAARSDLLRAVCRALLLAQGFRQLSRLLMAVSGRHIQVKLRPPAPGPAAPPIALAESGGTTYLLDPRWIAGLTPDDGFLRQWCDELMRNGAGPSSRPGAAPVPRHLEPV
jgi:hypothetical protein